MSKRKYEYQNNLLIVPTESFVGESQPKKVKSHGKPELTTQKPPTTVITPAQPTQKPPTTVITPAQLKQKPLTTVITPAQPTQKPPTTVITPAQPMQKPPTTVITPAQPTQKPPATVKIPIQQTSILPVKQPSEGYTALPAKDINANPIKSKSWASTFVECILPKKNLKLNLLEHNKQPSFNHFASKIPYKIPRKLNFADKNVAGLENIACNAVKASACTDAATYKNAPPKLINCAQSKTTSNNNVVSNNNDAPTNSKVKMNMPTKSVPFERNSVQLSSKSKKDTDNLPPQSKKKSSDSSVSDKNSASFSSDKSLQNTNDSKIKTELKYPKAGLFVESPMQNKACTRKNLDNLPPSKTPKSREIKREKKRTPSSTPTRSSSQSHKYNRDKLIRSPSSHKERNKPDKYTKLSSSIKSEQEAYKSLRFSSPNQDKMDKDRKSRLSRNKHADKINLEEQKSIETKRKLPSSIIKKERNKSEPNHVKVTEKYDTLKPTPVRSIVKLCDKKIENIQNDLSGGNMDLRLKLSRKNIRHNGKIRNRFIKYDKRQQGNRREKQMRDNLRITVHQDETTTVNKDVPVVAKKDVTKNIKCKKIELVINIICENNNASKTEDTIKAENSSSESDEDLSFLEDFDIDEIVESLSEGIKSIKQNADKSNTDQTNNGPVSNVKPVNPNSTFVKSEDGGNHTGTNLRFTKNFAEHEMNHKPLIKNVFENLQYKIKELSHDIKKPEGVKNNKITNCPPKDTSKKYNNQIEVGKDNNKPKTTYEKPEMDNCVQHHEPGISHIKDKNKHVVEDSDVNLDLDKPKSEMFNGDKLNNIVKVEMCSDVIVIDDTIDIQKDQSNIAMLTETADVKIQPKINLIQNDDTTIINERSDDITKPEGVKSNKITKNLPFDTSKKYAVAKNSTDVIVVDDNIEIQREQSNLTTLTETKDIHVQPEINLIQKNDSMIDPNYYVGVKTKLQALSKKQGKTENNSFLSKSQKSSLSVNTYETVSKPIKTDMCTLGDNQQGSILIRDVSKSDEKDIPNIRQNRPSITKHTIDLTLPDNRTKSEITRINSGSNQVNNKIVEVKLCPDVIVIDDDINDIPKQKSNLAKLTGAKDFQIRSEFNFKDTDSKIVNNGANGKKSMSQEPSLGEKVLNSTKTDFGTRENSHQGSTMIQKPETKILNMTKTVNTNKITSSEAQMQQHEKITKLYECHENLPEIKIQNKGNDETKTQKSCGTHAMSQKNNVKQISKTLPDQKIESIIDITDASVKEINKSKVSGEPDSNVQKTKISSDSGTKNNESTVVTQNTVTEIIKSNAITENVETMKPNQNLDVPEKEEKQTVDTICTKDNKLTCQVNNKHTAKTKTPFNKNIVEVKYTPKSLTNKVTKERINEKQNQSVAKSVQHFNEEPLNLQYLLNLTISNKIEQRLSEYMKAKFTITSIITTGKFSKIFKCNDDSGNEYAVKSLRYMSMSSVFGVQKEAMLMRLQNEIPRENLHLVYLISGFMTAGHWCFLMEYYPMNLQQAMAGNGKSFSIDSVQHLAVQLVSAVTLLRNNGIVHSDIKPSHILLNSNQTQLKLCGFDASYYVNENAPLNIGSINYRAPEIILGHSAYYPIDVWSVGAILYEMATLRQLFPGDDNNDILFKQMCTVGPVPHDMLQQSAFRSHHFTSTGIFKRKGINGEFELKPYFHKSGRIQRTITNAYEKYLRITGNFAENNRKNILLVNLLDRMLVIHPQLRLPIEFVSAHPFIHRIYSKSSIFSIS